MSRALGKALWLGGEGSGQVLRLGGSTNADRGHYVGPAVTVAQATRLGTEVELNGSFLRRIAGEGPTAALLLSVQVGL